MAEHEESSRLITAVFHAWQAAGIDFLVLRNYEDLPRFTTNDIDILVTKPQFKAAEKVLIQTAITQGFRLHNRAEFATLALYFSHAEMNAQVHFDLFTALKWRGFEFISGDEFLAKKIPRDSFFIPHPAHEAVTNLLAGFVFSGRVKEKYRGGIATAFRAEPEAARALLAKSYGQNLANQFVQSAAQENWSAIESQLRPARRTLIRRQFTQQFWKTFLSLDADCDRLLKRVFYPPGLVVVLCGPDGCGKSTVAPKLVELLSGTFSPQKSRQIHWKPRVFSKSRESGMPVTNPHGKPARNLLASHLYFKFHWLEFFLGWWLRILPVTFRGGLVLIDRFYYDFFVDQKRYRLRAPKFLVRLGYVLLPKPNLVFLLDASPEILQQRKQEVSLEETTRQRAAYVQMVNGLKNGKVINANQPADKVADDIQKVVLNFMAERTAKRKWLKPKNSGNAC